MSAMDVASVLYFAVSVATIPLLLIVILIPYLLPTNISGIPLKECPRPPSVSLIICTAVRAGLAVLDIFAAQDEMSPGRDGVVCDVDAVFNAFLTVAVLAHLPTIALTTYLSLPGDSQKDVKVASTTRTAILVALTYLYSIIPILPLIVALSVAGVGPGGFGMWWGMYCITIGPWWRIVRPLTSLVPPIVALAITALCAVTLNANKGHPSSDIRPTSRQKLATAFLALTCLLAAAYLITEQVIGWQVSWAPRAFEAAPGPMVFVAFACRKRLWSCWGAWLKRKRPLPPPASPLPFQSQFSISRQAKSPSSVHGSSDNSHGDHRTSSFYSPALSILAERTNDRRNSASAIGEMEHDMALPIAGEFMKKPSMVMRFDTSSWGRYPKPTDLSALQPAPRQFSDRREKQREEVVSEQFPYSSDDHAPPEYFVNNQASNRLTTNTFSQYSQSSIPEIYEDIDSSEPLVDASSQVHRVGGRYGGSVPSMQEGSIIAFPFSASTASTPEPTLSRALSRYEGRSAVTPPTPLGDRPIPWAAQGRQSKRGNMI